jgi:hypothetical protein
MNNNNYYNIDIYSNNNNNYDNDNHIYNKYKNNNKNIYKNNIYKQIYSFYFNYLSYLPIIKFFISIIFFIILITFILINLKKENINLIEILKNRENQIYLNNNNNTNSTNNISNINNNNISNISNINNNNISNINNLIFSKNFYKVKTLYPIFFTLYNFLYSYIGALNIWFICNLFYQRFSVPEFYNKKINIKIMFFFGITSKFVFLLIGILPEDIYLLNNSNIIKTKTEEKKSNYEEIKIKNLIFLLSIFFNILFNIISIENLQCLRNLIKCDDNFFNKILKIKKINLVFLFFLMIFYVIIIIIPLGTYRNFIILIFSLEYSTMSIIFRKIILYFFPYFIFFLNCFLDLFCYWDIIYLQNNLKNFIDKKYFYFYFLEEEENNEFI